MDSVVKQKFWSYPKVTRGTKILLALVSKILFEIPCLQGTVPAVVLFQTQVFNLLFPRWYVHTLLRSVCLSHWISFYFFYKTVKRIYYRASIIFLINCICYTVFMGILRSLLISEVQHIGVFYWGNSTERKSDCTWGINQTYFIQICYNLLTLTCLWSHSLCHKNVYCWAVFCIF